MVGERQYLTSRSGRIVGWVQETCGYEFVYGWDGRLYGSKYNGCCYDECGRYLGNDSSFIIAHLLTEYSKVYPNDF